MNSNTLFIIQHGITETKVIPCKKPVFNLDRLTMYIKFYDCKMKNIVKYLLVF